MYYRPRSLYSVPGYVTLKGILLLMLLWQSPLPAYASDLEPVTAQDTQNLKDLA